MIRRENSKFRVLKCWKRKQYKREPWDYWFILITNPPQTEALTLELYVGPNF